MATTTVDYLVSIVIVSMLLTTSILLVGQTINIALINHQDQQITLAAVDLLDNLLQNPGNPPDWGWLSIQPTGFGLKWPNSAVEMLSPFTLMRLMQTGNSAIYNNILYRNLGTNNQFNLYLREDEYVDYITASKLLSTYGNYGFKLSITPVLNISVTQIKVNPLKLKITIYGTSGPLSGALLNSTLYYINNRGTSPSIVEYTPLSKESNIDGEAEIEFPGLNSNEIIYLALVKVNLAGLSGIGYHTNAADPFIIPVVTNYSEGKVTLFSNPVIPSTIGGLLYCNLRFVIQAGKSEFNLIKISNSIEILQSGKPVNITLGTRNPGVLLISSKTSQSKSCLTAMPWGISSLGLSLIFGGNPRNQKTVVVQSRYVMIDKISYQIKLALWRLDG